MFWEKGHTFAPWGFFRIESYQWLKNWYFIGYTARRLTLQVSAGTGWSDDSILWLGEIVWSETSIPVWQHVNLSKQIGPWDTLACCWNGRKPTNQQHRKQMGLYHWKTRRWITHVFLCQKALKHSVDLYKLKRIQAIQQSRTSGCFEITCSGFKP